MTKNYASWLLPGIGAALLTHALLVRGVADDEERYFTCPAPARIKIHIPSTNTSSSKVAII